MKKKLHIVFWALFLPLIVYGQDTIPVVTMDSLLTPKRMAIPEENFPSDAVITDSVMQSDFDLVTSPVSTIDTTRRVNYWHITKRTGEIIPIVPDTFLTDYFNRTNVEGQGISVAYLGNLGLPSESRLFFDRKDRSEFMFLDPFWAYDKQPDNFDFINTKIPHSNVSYQSSGSRKNKEERLQALLALNFGKELNVGFSADYLYARGFYNSQASKHLDWVFFSNYLSDRHQLHLLLNPANYTNGENGGLSDDRWITNPEEIDSRNAQTQDIPTQISNTWNKLKGGRYYLNYHYNLGYKKDTGQKDEEGETITQFIPVSSIIYTFDYTARKHRFYTTDSASLNQFYNYVDFLNPLRENKMPVDSTSYNSMSNTLGLSLREGFKEWAKFDLTAFITQDIRNFTMMDTTKTKQYATYIGGELAKRTGKILQYNAQGSLGVLGYNVGDINLSGNIETRIPFLNDTASVSANGYIKNLSPTFYENHYHSQYFWWNNDFSKVKKVFVGGNIDIPHTGTNFGLGVENITGYIYFDENGYPKQHWQSIRVLAATLQQKIKLGALNWNSQVVYQTSSNQDVIPLPDLSAYSSLFLHFTIAKVLTIQMGANAHYWTKYYSPDYEPATQQFKLQRNIKIGEFPLINGFINCHLKQTRFFIEYYNLGASVISPPEYFSIPHYPVNSPGLRWGLSVDFIN